MKPYEDVLWEALNNLLAAVDRFQKAPSVFTSTYTYSPYSPEEWPTSWTAFNNLKNAKEKSEAVLESYDQYPDPPRAFSFRSIGEHDKVDPEEGEESPYVIVVQDGRRYLAQWDSDSGYFFGYYPLDGLEQHKVYPNYYEESPGRLYGATHIAPIPKVS